jgi:glycosyl transferase family 87
VLGLLLVPGPARADQHRLSPQRVIAIAASDPAVAPIKLQNPGAHWEVVFDTKRGTWSAALEAKGAHTVLASFTIRDRDSAIVAHHVASVLGPPRLTSDQAVQLARRSQSLRDWIGQYRRVQGSASLGDDRVWTVRFDARDGSEVAEARVYDTSMSLIGVRTGPQVDWQLARGEPNSYGRLANRWWVFLPLCLIFLGGLIDWRRPLSLRTLDLLVVLSFGISLIWFIRGEVFWSTPLVYPPLLYLLARMLGIGFSRRPRQIDIGSTHALVLVALTFALIGFRLGLNNQNSNILDVGYAGVVGADRLLNGTLPYGHMPIKAGDPCGGRYSNGDAIGYVQATNGRCESPIESGDTYGPAVYLAYVPFVAVFGWSGLWDDLPAAHVAASAFDLLAVAGLFVAGWRFRSARLGVLLAFAWAANPFTLYALNMNTNDALVGALLAWMIAALSLPAARGVLLAAAGLTKLGPLALVPLLLSLRNRTATAIGLAAGSLALLSMLALDGNGLRLFWDRTFHYQLGRVTPLSIWTIGSYHPGWHHLHWLQQALQVAVVLGCLLLAVLPRGRKDAAQVAALAAAALIATQLVSSYWFYPYICWWLPLVLLGLLLPRGEPSLSPR